MITLFKSNMCLWLQACFLRTISKGIGSKTGVRLPLSLPQWELFTCWLTQLPLDKKAAILANDNFKRILKKNEIDRIPIWISLKFVLRSPVDNKPALVQVMAWCRRGAKPLPEPMLTNNDIYAALGGDVLRESITCNQTPVAFITKFRAWISNYINGFLWDVITHPFPDFKGSLCKLGYESVITSHPFRWKYLTHWGRVMHICVDNLAVIGSDNGLSPGRRQAIIWTNDGILLIRPSGTNFSEVLIEIHIFHWRKCIWKCLEKVAILSRPQCVNHASHNIHLVQLISVWYKRCW